MAPLPPIQSSTLRAIYAAREAGAESWDSIGISMSELGSDCDRALWYAHRWASVAEKLDAPKLRRFETGNIEEERLIADLRRVPGVEVVDRDPDRVDENGKPQQFKVYSHGGHVRGKLDGLAVGLPEAPKTWHVVECKSHKNDSFQALVKKGVKESKPAHFLQCQKYMQQMSLTRCLYIAVNKDNDEEYCERIDFDAVIVMQLDARLDRVIGSPEAPSRIKDKPTAYPCIICRHKDVCHGDAFGRNHCRSCLHSTPVVDWGGHDAKWVCEKFGKTLTIEEQRAGCHAHLYLPDMVPGKQVDAGDDWVAYELRDGSRWVDQEKKASPESSRYWYHSESGALWESPNDEKAKPGAELVEELSADEYERALAYFREQKSNNEAAEAKESAQ